MVNTILAKRVNHIVAKGDNPVWPKGSKSRGFSKKGNNEYQYDLNPARFNEEIGCMAHSFFSKTLLLFYGIPTIVIVFLIIRLICQYIHSMT